MKRQKAFKTLEIGTSLVAPWVMELALSLLWLRFDPWPGNFCMPLVQEGK